MANSINDNGRIVGSSHMWRYDYAFVYENGRMRGLKGIGGGEGDEYATALNHSNQAVGAAADPRNGGVPHACLWNLARPDEPPTDLGTLGSHSVALDINHHGQVVGWSYVAQNGKHEERAFVWQDGQMRDLNTLIPPDSGWVLESAHAINDQGQIIGRGTRDGKTHAFLLTPYLAEETIMAARVAASPTESNEV
jgi:probable HAF family extracellular repeat protein